MNRKFASLAATAMAVSVAACGGPDAEFEIGATPDAAQVTSAPQAPLYIPPEYAVRPSSAPGPRDSRPAPRVGLSQGESSLLALAGVADANPNIRTLVDQDSSTQAVVEPYRVERLVLSGSQTPPPGLIIMRHESRTLADPLSVF